MIPSFYEPIIDQAVQNGFHILCVDDAPIDRTMLKDLISNADTEVRPYTPPYPIKDRATLARSPRLLHYLARRPHNVKVTGSSAEFKIALERTYQGLDAILIDLKLDEELGKGCYDNSGECPEDGVVLARHVHELYERKNVARPPIYLCSGAEEFELLKFVREELIEGALPKGKLATDWKRGDIAQHIIIDKALLQQNHYIAQRHSARERK